jgi:transposase
MVVQISQTAAMRRDDICLYVSPANRAQLKAIIVDRNSPRKLVWRAEIVLATADGLGTNAIMRRTGKSKPAVWRWQERYMDEGVEGLKRDKTRPSRKPPLSAPTKLAVIKKTTTEKPAGATHWSAREMAKVMGLSHRSIQRIWAEAGLKPHLARSFKLSNDPNFEAKVTDIIGLYLNPPDKAIVLCVDEKSQIQALDRTQPGLPMKRGRAATMTHDYKRNGTTTLFAALNVKTGEVIGECRARHRAKEFIGFLKKIDRTVAKQLDLHLICDNYGTHKTVQVQSWLAKHPRFQLHFTPTSASWINLVERLFAEVTRQRIRRGVFKSVEQLEAAINDWITHRNTEPKPFTWTKTADTIIAKNRRARAVLEAVKTGNQTLESEH